MVLHGCQCKVVAHGRSTLGADRRVPSALHSPLSHATLVEIRVKLMRGHFDAGLRQEDVLRWISFPLLLR